MMLRPINAVTANTTFTTINAFSMDHLVDRAGIARTSRACSGLRRREVPSGPTAAVTRVIIASPPTPSPRPQGSSRDPRGTPDLHRAWELPGGGGTPDREGSDVLDRRDLLRGEIGPLQSLDHLRDDLAHQCPAFVR
jgi:hypothetical protein